MNLCWTERDLDILETLALRVRLLSLEQITRIWWPAAGSPRPVRRRLRRLVAGRLVHRVVANVHPPIDISQPLTSWRPGMPRPDLARLAQPIRDRWQLPAVPTELFHATRVAANLFAGHAWRLPPVGQRDHQLLLGQVYLHYRRAHPQEARSWLAADACGSAAGNHHPRPDAVLRGPAGTLRAIESTGRHSVDRLARLHAYCLHEQLPYELW